MILARRLRGIDPALAAIVAEGFLSRLSFGLLSFALPLYAYQRFGLTLTQIGILLSLNLAVAILLKPLAGSVADRVGMRPTFAAAIGLRSLVSLLLAFVAAPWQLFAVRSVHGVSIALRDPPASVLLAERGAGSGVASAFAWYQTAKSVAGALGKAAAGVLLAVSSSSFTLVFLCAFVLSALPVFVVLRYVRGEATNLPPDPMAEPGELAPTEERPAAVGRPRMLPYLGVGFLISSTAYMLANLFPVFAVEYAGLTTAQTGLIYLIAPAVVLTGPVFGWISDNVSRKLVLSVRSVANIGSSVVYLLAPTFAGVMVGRLVDDMGKAAFRPAWGAMMAEVAGFDRRTRARTMGSMSAGEDAGEVAGPILAGFIWSTWGAPVLLGARIVLAVVTEVATFVMTRSLERSAIGPTRREARTHAPPRVAAPGESGMP
jgi:MFS family permease